MIAGVHPLDVLGDPVRRRLLERLALGETTAGELSELARGEFGITQPAVSRQLRILRENGFVAVRPEGTRRWYSVRPDGFRTTNDWLARYRAFWEQRVDALETELVRGRRGRHRPASSTAGGRSA
jgi:DNA-binding transcriptional ArsR family regulator